MIPDEAIEAAAVALNVWLSEPYDEAGLSELHPEVMVILEAALPYLSEAAKQPQRNSPTDWPDIPKAQS